MTCTMVSQIGQVHLITTGKLTKIVVIGQEAVKSECWKKCIWGLCAI